MANTATYLNKEKWSKDLQVSLFVENTAVFLAGTEASSVLSADGRKFHKPILSHPTTGTYTPGNEISDKAYVSTDEELEVDTFKYSSVYVDDTEKKQSSYELTSRISNSMQKQLNNLIEQAFLNRVKTDAVHTVDAGSVGGSAGSNIELLASNASQIFTAAHTKLDLVDAPRVGRVAVVGPHTVGVLRETKAGRETGLGDSVLANGIIGPWQGWIVVQNNNLPWTATLTIADQPTDGDTVTIAGVTFTFKDDISGGTAGYVAIGGSAAAARANLAYAVLGTGTVGTNYNDVSGEDRFILEKRNLSCGTDEGMLFTGNGDIVVSETFNSDSNLWSAQTQYSWFGLRGATDLCVQMPTEVEVRRADKLFGDRIQALEGYGVKTFADGARGLIAVKISAENWV
jgi:hypothetical protein